MKEASRFCFLTTFYPPFNFGGDGIGVQRLARGLAKRGHDVTVIHDADAYTVLSPGASPEPPAPDPYGVTVVTLRTRLPYLSTLLTQQIGRPIVNGPRLRALLEAGRFDVVTFNNVSLIGGPGLLAHGNGAVKLYLAHEHWLVCPTHVLWRHGQERCDKRECVRCQLRHRRPPQLWRYTGLLDRQIEEIDTFIAMSEFSRAKHREFGFPREMEVLPYFLPDPPDAALPRVRAQRPHDRPYFLYVGRLETIKGVDELVDAFASYGDADLLVIGDGSHAAALSARAAGNPRIRFLGRVPADELGPYYQHAISLIVPSVCFETFGIILIEAFSHATPVIARRLGPFPEIVEQSGGGALFDTAEELISAMRAMQSSPERRRSLGEAGYEAYKTRWCESAVIPRYLDVVERARDARARGPH
jgi:glycosyltransferase involved in cell wall biosynthesis